MSTASSEARLENDEAGMKTMDKTKYYFSREINPWPAPPLVAMGSFRKAAESPVASKKKYGGGFGSFSGANTFTFSGASSGSNFDVFSGFGVRKEKAATSRPSLFGTLTSSRLAAGDSPTQERSATPTTSEIVSNGSRRCGFSTSSPRSEVVTPTKRPRSGRRTGRRGRSGPGHCFHCQEHGHISRLCPKKTVDDPEFDEVEASRYLDDEMLMGAPKAGSLIGRDSGSYQSAKLENQKVRESYYGGYGYGTNNSTISTTSNNNNSAASKTVNAMTSKYATAGAAVSPDSDKFSEQLDNALKLHVVKPAVAATTTPPRAPISSGIQKSPVGSSQKTEAPPVKTASLGLKDRIKETSSETMTIETRRTVTLEGDTRFEETTVISFPSVLPPNVRVITAQFVPVSSQIPGEIIKEKF